MPAADSNFFQKLRGLLLMANSTDSTSGGSNPNPLEGSPWGRLSEVGITDLSTLFSGVGNQSSGKGNPFAGNPVGAQVLFGGGNSNGGSPFSNLRTNIDKLVSSSTGGSNPMSGGGTQSGTGDSVFPQSPTGGTGSSPSFGGGGTGSSPSFGGGGTGSSPSFGGGGTGSSPSFGGGGTGSSPSFGGGGTGSSPSGLTDPFAPGGAFGIPSAETFDFAKYGIPTEGSFDLAKYGIPTGGIGSGTGTGIPSFGGSDSGIPSFGGGSGGGIPSFGGGGGNGIPSA
jgi:hypothetical protein